MSYAKLESLSEEEMTALNDDEPFIAYFFFQSTIIEDPEFKAAAGVAVIKGKPHLWLNPGKMNQFSMREKIGVIVHEYLHVMLAHCTVRTTGVKELHIIENIAKDMAINQVVNNAWDLPSGCVSYSDPRFNFKEKLSSEEYFNLIYEKFDPEEVEKQFGGMGFDDHSEWSDEDDSSGTQIVKAMAKRYLQATGAQRGEALKGAGAYGDQMISEILAIEEHDIDWKQKARIFMHKVACPKQKPTWKRPNKRYGLPFQGSQRKTMNKVMALVDTSGSMSDNWLAHIGGHLNQMCRIMQVDVVFCDAEVSGHYKKHKPSKNLQYPGRGGTNMQPGFDFAAQEGYRGVICFTDGGLFTDPVSKIPTLWVVCNYPEFRLPFGQVAHVNWKGH